MAIISHVCSTSCWAELPHALQDISRQAVPSISETFTGCPACNNWRNCSRQPLRFTESCGAVLVQLTKDRAPRACPWIHTGTWDCSGDKQATSFIYKSTVHDVFLMLVESQSPAMPAGGTAWLWKAQSDHPKVLPQCEPTTARGAVCQGQESKSWREKQPDMLTWTGPMLLFLPPGMPSSLIAERKQANLGKERLLFSSWWGMLLLGILEVHKKVSTVLRKTSLCLKRLILFIKAVYTETCSAFQGTGKIKLYMPWSSP